MTKAKEIRIPITHEADIVAARQAGREIAAECGFSRSEQTLIATAISEVARNIVSYAVRGEVVLSLALEAGRKGVIIVARDEGPGIPNVELAMRDGYSTGASLGMGLPGAKRLMDEFDLLSKEGEGVTVTMKKWVL
jgi:serine/threonine-protein kinase RsbT